MDNILDKEYHPVIEDFIFQYVEGSMDVPAQGAFSELLVYDDELRDFTFAAQSGKRIMESFRELKGFDTLMKKLNSLSPT